jgi:uncharacterized membrane protein/uncharacterized protein YegL
MTFIRPLFLLLAVLLPLLWYWDKRSIGPLRARRKLVALATRCLVTLLVIFALAEARWRGQSREEHVFLMVDRSRSIGNLGLEKALAFAKDAKIPESRMQWIDFAGQPRLHETQAALEKSGIAQLNPDETRIDAAIALAAASFPPGRVKTIVLFTDGNSTGGKVASGDLAKQDIRVHAVETAPPDVAETLVREVHVPASVRAEEPVRIEAIVQTSRAGAANLDLFRNGIRVATRPVTLRKGPNTVLFDDRAGDDKVLHYEVGVRATLDTIADNNQTGAAALSQGAAKVLLITDRPESSRYLEWALRQEGIQLSTRPEQGAPSAMTDLQNFDAVIIDNVPASSLSREQMEIFRTYVRDFGGGLVMLGGDQAFGLGGYYRTAVEDVLPVQCDFQKEEENPSLALVLVIDRSGSMSGDKIELAKAAAKASSDLLSPRDYISIIAFDHEIYPLTGLISANNPGGVASKIASITAEGGTNMAPGMEEALRQLTSNNAKLKHVIVLTDGVSTPGPFYELATQMAANNITCSTVAIGDADNDLLSQIARWGNGRYYEATDPNTVPQIFTKETMTASKSAIQEFPFLAKPVRAVDFLEGVPWSDSPFLLGYVRTKAKPTSETWLLTERGDPLLTTWRFGLGISVAFTSDARNRWALEWLRWPGFGKFWAQLLRRVSRPEALGMSEVELESHGDSVEITVDAIDEQGAGMATATAKISMPDGKALELPLEKTLPGRWSATLSTPVRGLYSGQIRVTRGDEAVASNMFTHLRGYSDEFLLDPPNRPFLEELTKATGGMLMPDPAKVFLSKDRTAPVEIELWPWLALAALLLFVGDVAVRRWPD